MPAQSGDPITSVIQSSLVNSSSKKDSSDVSSLLSYSSKQVFLVDIKYEEYHSDSTSFLSDLKSKYLVISEKDSCDTNESESANSNKFVLSKGNFEKTNGVDRANGLDRTDGKVSKPKLPSPERVLWPPENISLGWKDESPVGGGFINLGNSCYINSTLQALFHIPSFVNWLLMENSHTCPTKPPYSSADCLICAMSQTLKSAQENTGKAIKPYLIFSRLKSICKQLNPGLQEDAHEFLRHLIDSLDRTYLMPYKGLRLDHLSKETTPLSQIFGGYLRNEVVCQACGHVSTTFQYFQDMPLDIRNSSHIDGALEMFFSRESLSEQEGYVCENCKKKVPFTKKFFLEKAPKVLCVQLKRFGSFSGKNNKVVGISQKLNLNRFKEVKNGESFESYQLTAVVNHLGTSTNCGHYTALAMASDSRYYLFDDQRVESLHDMSQYSSHAYILLYEQKPNSAIVPNGVKPELVQQKLNNTFKNSLIQPGSSLIKSKYFNKDNIISRVRTESPSKEPEEAVEEKKKEEDAEEEEEEVSGVSTCEADINKSLVPYNESSSESEGSTSREESRCTSPEPMVNGKATSRSGSRDSGKQEETQETTPSKKSEERAAQPLNGSSSSQSNKSHSFSNGDTFKVANGFTPSTPKNKYNGDRSSSNNGHWASWKVTPNYDQPSSPNKSNQSKNNWKVRSSNQNRMDYKSQLMDMGHRGYGKQVSTWSGEKSEIEKDISRENFVNQRLAISFEDKCEPPLRKIKKYHNGSFDSGKNRFQELQKRKNWMYGKGKYNYYERSRSSNDNYHRPRQWQHHHI